MAENPKPGASERSSDPELPTEPEVHEIVPGAFFYINANGRWNSGWVEGDDGVAVIDAMLTPADARKVLAEIRARTDKPIRYLIITHQHSDHYLGAQVYAPPAEIIAHREIRHHYTHNLEQEFAFRAQISPNADLSEVEVVLPTITVDGEGKVMTLHLGNRDLEVYFYGPGQTPDALFIYLPADKVLYCGDVFNRKSINYMGNATSLDGWFAILDRIEAMDVDVYLGGHGLPATKGDMNAYRGMMNDFIGGVTESLDRGLTAEEAVAALDLSKYREWRNYNNFRERNIVGLYRNFEADRAAETLQD